MTLTATSKLMTAQEGPHRAEAVENIKHKTPWVYGALKVDYIDVDVTIPIRRPFHCGLSFNYRLVCTSLKKKAVIWVVYLKQ